MSRSRIRRKTDTEGGVARVAALLADPARATMLWRLADGRAFPAGELARSAGIRPSTASFHLAQLVEAGWLAVERRGRRRYVRLVNEDVAALLEQLAVVAGSEPGRDKPRREPPADLALARSCYDHLAGRAGTAVAEVLVAEGALRERGRDYLITESGRARFARLGIDIGLLEQEAHRRRRRMASACLDWTERRHHVAGALGQALLELVLSAGWLERRHGTRALRLTNTGRRALSKEFGIRLI